MKKGLIGLAVLAIVLVLLMTFGVASYNDLREKQDAVKGRESVLQAELQTRSNVVFDLLDAIGERIPRDRSERRAVMVACSEVQRAATTREMIEADAQLDEALTRLWPVVDADSDLHADAAVSDLRAGLSEMAGGVASARRQYDDAVFVYNDSIARFPASVFAGLFAFGAE